MRNGIARSLTAVLLFLALLVQGTWVLAGTTGSISGSVSDRNGAPLAAVSVTVTSPSQSMTTTTNAQGRFAFASLAPDTYTISIAKPGFAPIAQQGITVTADQDDRLTFAAAPQIAEIGRTRSRANTELVKAGTIQDVYTISSAQQQAVQGMGGGGSLNQAYSAISSVPGVYVPQGQQGWAQSVYIRGGNYTSLGYEYDGVPTQRAFDAYPGGTVTALGQQELQIYTGAAPADASSNGLAGFINQVIRTGTSPLTKTLSLGVGGPALYHKGQAEISGATPNRAFSYYVAGAAYTQDFRYADQFNGASYAQTYGGGYANAIQANCGDPARATAPCYAAFNNSGLGPSGFQALPFSFGFNDRNVAAEFVGNFHIGLPHKNGNRDDVQVLVNNSWNRGIFETGLTSFGNTLSAVNGGSGVFDGVPYRSCADPAADPNFCGVNGTGGPTYQDAYHYGGPVGTVLRPGDVGNIAPYFQPKSLQHAYGSGFYDPNTRDQQDIRASIVKLQYQKNFGSDAYLRLYGYTFYTDWLNGNGGPGATAAAFPGTDGTVPFNSPDYDLISHERGLNATFVKQLGDKHLVNLSSSYVSASTIRNNNGYYSLAGGPVRNVALLVDSTNPTNGLCYSTALAPVYCGGPGAVAYRLPGINGVPVNGQLQPNTSNPAFTVGNVGAMTCGGGPCEYFTVDSGFRGSYNHVRPQFTTVALSDSWKPNTRLTLDLALKFENFVYQLADTTAPANYGFNTSAAARTLYTNSYNLFNCFGGPTVGYTTTTTAGACPAGYAPVQFSAASPASFRFAYLEPRLGATLQLDRENVLRFSAGQYVQPTNTAYVQYDRVEANVAAYDVGKFYSNGYADPAHPVRPEKSQNFDFSWEHQIHGTDASFSVTPFLRKTKDENVLVLLDPVTNFVSAINVGQKRVSGFEFIARKGDFARNGLSGQLSYTYTDAKLKFKPLPSGTTALDGVNASIQTYNGFTSFCAGNPADGRCGANSATASACYTTAGSPAACGPGMVANPYWNAPVQGLFDPGSSYVPFNQLPGTGLGTVSSSYVVPHVASLALNWRKDRLAITPTVQFAAGGKYGTPVNGVGIDPTTCAGTLGTAPDPQRYGYGAPGGNAYDATTCAGTITAPDRYTGRFDNFGAFTEPSALVANLQMSYDVSKRATVTLLATNIYNHCFGGSQEPWTSGNGHVNCWYGSPTVFTGNLFNPGTQIQNSAAYPYAPAFGNVFQQAFGAQTNPFNLFLNVSLKM